MPVSGAHASLVDVVDEDDRVVRTVTRAEMRAQRLRHRATFVLVMSTRGEVLVHRRAEDKDLWPGRWDLAVGGVVEHGESWDEAAARELAEEVGVSGVLLEPVGTGTYEDDDVRVVGRVYRAVSDGPFTFADGEVVFAELLTPDALRARLATASFVPDSVAIALPHLR